MGLRCATRTLPAPLSATPSPALSVYLRECVAAGSASARTACPIPPISASLGPATATQVLYTLMPVSTPPTGLIQYLLFISLVLDTLAIRFSVSSGCARRRSVSTYAAILVLPMSDVFKYQKLRGLTLEFINILNQFGLKIYKL